MQTNVAESGKKSQHKGLPDLRTSGLPDFRGNRLLQVFSALRAAQKKAFIAYICAGDPTLERTIELVPALARAGVDVIELGIPYSDPMADGVAIQAACERALRSGTTIRGVLDAVRRIRQDSQVPILLFTYLNPVMAYGIARFAADAVSAGADGVLLLDLPPDEDHTVIDALRAAGLANVCLVAPTTTAMRRRMLAHESRGFVYYVCRLGVTGERATLPDDLAEKAAALKAAGDVPVCIGFGISTPEQAAAAATAGDGAVVGSHFVRLIERTGDRADLAAIVAQRAAEMTAAVHAVRG